jgi:hypothetical protein
MFFDSQVGRTSRSAPGFPTRPFGESGQPVAKPDTAQRTSTATCVTLKW